MTLPTTRILILALFTLGLIQCQGSNGSNEPTPNQSENPPVQNNEGCIAGLSINASAPVNCNPDGTPNDPNDPDADGLETGADNCYNVFNPSQTDSDGDNIGDACDNCPQISNTNQMDADSDSIGNLCDTDSDGDGVLESDNCPAVPNTDQANDDGDSCGNACDDAPNLAGVCRDHDHDGISDSNDNCPTEGNPEQYDFDNDNIGNACDADDDNDGLPDLNDPYPLTPGIICTGDSDGDGICNDFDNCPTQPDAGNDCELIAPEENDTESSATLPGCELNNALDPDCDGYLEAYGEDNCPNLTNPEQRDTDGDGIGNACEPEGCLNNPDTTCGVIEPEPEPEPEPDENPNDIDGDGLANSIDPNNSFVNQWGYFDKDETSAQCVLEYFFLVPLNVQYLAGSKKGTALGASIKVTGVLNSNKAITPRRDNCKKVIVPNSSGNGGTVSSPIPLSDNYGIYIMNGLAN